jgi:hypothetical protein
MPFDLSTAKPVSSGFDLSTAKPIKSTDWGRIAAEAAGGVVGGMVALPEAAVAAVPTLGIGGLAAEAAGVGLGSAAGGQLYDIARRYFTKEPPPSLAENLKTAATDVGLNAVAAPLGRAGVAGAKMAAPYVEPYVRPVLEAIPGTTTKAQRLAKGLIQRATQAGENVSYTAAQQKAAAEAAAEKARSAFAVAQQETANAEKVHAQAVANEAQVKSTPIEPQPVIQPQKIGQVREATAEIGNPVKSATINEERNIKAARSKNDAYLRQAQNDIVSDNEARNIKITDMPSYKEIVAKANPIANWQWAGASKPDKSVVKTYEGLMETIAPQAEKIPADKIEIARANGIPIQQVGKDFYRNVEPTFESIENARRFLGDVFSGRKAPEGYSALKDIERQNLYGLLDKIQEEYVGAAHPRLQANWREATAKLKAFNESVGPKIIKTQPENVAKMLFSNKGASAFDEAVAVTGSERIPRKALSDQIATDMADKNYAGALKVREKYKQVLQNPKLADLKARVNEHIVKLNDNEIAGVETKNLNLAERQQAKEQVKLTKEQVSAAAQRAKEQADLAETQSGEAAKAARRERIHTNAVSKIIATAEKNPKKGAKQAISYIKRLSDSGQISTSEYNAALKEYNKIDFAKPAAARASIHKWLKRGAIGGLIAGGATKYHYLLP